MGDSDGPTEAGLRRVPLGYLWEATDSETHVGLGITFTAERLLRRGANISAEILVRSSVSGILHHLFHSRSNLDTAYSKRETAKALEELAGPQWPWRSLVERFCMAVLEAERQGAGFHQATRPIGGYRITYLIDQLLLSGAPNLVFGPWASGKGWIGVTASVCVAAGLPMAGLPVERGAVLYLDWEDDQQIFDRRCWAIASGLKLDEVPRNLWYRECRQPLVDQIDQITRFVHDHEIALVCIDSVGLAGGSGSEHGTYEDRALVLFEAIRQYRATHLLIDHVSEEGRRNNQTAGKAIGSVYKMNSARQAWELRKDQEIRAVRIRVGLYHAKPQHTPLLGPLGFEFDFSDANKVTVHRVDIRESGELSGRLPVHMRIRDLLVRGPMSVKGIADELGITASGVRTELARHRDWFTRTSDGKIGMLMIPEDPDDIPF